MVSGRQPSLRARRRIPGGHADDDIETRFRCFGFGKSDEPDRVRSSHRNGGHLDSTPDQSENLFIGVFGESNSKSCRQKATSEASQEIWNESTSNRHPRLKVVASTGIGFGTQWSLQQAGFVREDDWGPRICIRWIGRDHIFYSLLIFSIFCSS